MPERVLRWHQEIDRLTAVRLEQVKAAGQRLRAWAADRPDLPQWLRESLATAFTGRDGSQLQHPYPSALARVALVWRDQRWAGDEAGFEHLEAWRRHDVHLWLSTAT